MYYANRGRGALFLGAALLLAPGCHRSGEPPRLAESVDNPAYAVGYAQEVEVRRARLSEMFEACSVTLGLMAQFPNELSEPDWELTGQLYQDAAEEGKGEAYASRQNERELVSRFFTEEQKALVGRTAGAAQHAAKQEGHELKLYGPIGYAMEKGVEKQLDERRQAVSLVHATIQEQETRLGKQNIKPLSEQVDRIALASYFANYRMQLELMDAGELESKIETAEETLQERRKQLQQADKPDDKQIARIDEALAELTTAKASVKQTVEAVEARKEKLPEEFQTALDDLLQRVKQKQQAAAGK